MSDDEEYVRYSRDRSKLLLSMYKSKKDSNKKHEKHKSSLILNFAILITAIIFFIIFL